jgi:hypothetical protein
MVSLPYEGERRPRDLSFGRFLIAAVTGNWSRARNEQLAMGESFDITGGVMVPETVSRSVLDYARARTCVIRAGARTVQMTSDRMQIPRVSDDPTIEGDLAALTSGDGTNSAKLCLPAPPDIAEMSRYVTSNCPNANIFIGDVTQMLFGVRGGPRGVVAGRAVIGGRRPKRSTCSRTRLGRPRSWRCSKQDLRVGRKNNASSKAKTTWDWASIKLRRGPAGTGMPRWLCWPIAS